MSNDEQDRMSRRRFLHSLGLVGLAGTSGSLLAACGGSDDSSQQTADASDACADLSTLSDQEMQQREQMVESLNYVHESPQNEQFCSNCQLYLQEEYGEGCGGCQLFPGPVHAGGYCNSWAPAT